MYKILLITLLYKQISWVQSTCYDILLIKIIFLNLRLNEMKYAIFVNYVNKDSLKSKLSGNRTNYTVSLVCVSVRNLTLKIYIKI